MLIPPVLWFILSRFSVFFAKEMAQQTVSGHTQKHHQKIPIKGDGERYHGHQNKTYQTHISRIEIDHLIQWHIHIIQHEKQVNS